MEFFVKDYFAIDINYMYENFTDSRSLPLDGRS